MTQLQAGYILDCVKETLETKYTPTEVKGLLKQLSYFDIEINSTITPNNNSDFEQTLSVAHNRKLQRSFFTLSAIYYAS
jgi:uncharacterized protein (UPF0212 family)